MTSPDGPDACGYAHPAYARSFADIATPVTLPRSRGTVLARPIPGHALKDVMGPYPLFACADWRGLAADLATLAADYVAFVAVADPACPLSQDELAKTFGIVRPLGPRYLIDLPAFSTTAIERHHARKLRRADAGTIEIRSGADAAACAADFAALYRGLAERKGMTGFRRLSDAILAQQLAVPGTVVVAARDGQDLLGMDVYYESGDWAYAHLSAYSERGYARSASYPMMAAAIEHFAGRVKTIDLGGVPRGDGSEGLAFFKAGWSNASCATLLCGAVLRADDMRALGGGDPTGYFPPYRAGEVW